MKAYYIKGRYIWQLPISTASSRTRRKFMIGWFNGILLTKSIILLWSGIALEKKGESYLEEFNLGTLCSS